MPRLQKYPAPPIIDSIVELRLERKFDDSEISRIVKAIGKNYDRVDQLNEADVSIRVEGQKVTPSVANHRPVQILSNSDQTDFFRLERQKLHWSRLPPYEGWEALENRIEIDLQSLPKKVGFPKLERIGVRFLNRLDVPLGSDQIYRYEDYISVHIALPPLLNPHGPYMWTVVKEFPEKGLGTKITSGVVNQELPFTMAILLDIDVYTTANLPEGRDALFGRLNELRHFKNEIFEACITDKARANFQ